MNFKHWMHTQILLLTAFFAFCKPIDAADDRTRLSSLSVTVEGRVFCDTCFHRKLTTTSHFLPGAWVAVGCNIRGHGAALEGKAEANTDEHGFYRIKIPLGFRSEKEIEKCSVQLLRSSIIWCGVPFIRNRSGLAIKSMIKEGYLYRAAPLSFRPPRLPALCKTKLEGGFSSSKIDFPPISFPLPFPFPPISLPYPPIPPIQFPLPPLLPPFWDIPPIPFWPPLPNVSPNPPPPPPPPDQIVSGDAPPPPPPPLWDVNPPPPTLPIVHHVSPPPPLATPPSFLLSP